MNTSRTASRTFQQLVVEVPDYPEKPYTLSGPTFGEVYRMAARLNDHFAVSAGSRETVCLATENKAVIAAAFLAGLCSRVTLVLPHALSPQALARVREISAFTAIIADPDRETLPGVKKLWPQTGSAKRLAFTRDPDRELLQLFTGGSTGSPRIWSKSGRNLLAEARFLADHFTVGNRDIIVATISPCHIYGLLFSVLIPLVSSATVLARTPSFPAEIKQAVQGSKATVLAAVPAHYRVLRNGPVSSGSLRFAVSSAGMLDPEDNRRFCDHNKSGIIEVYGSTETGGIATRNRAAGQTTFTPFSSVDWKVSDGRLLVRSPYISRAVPRDRDGFFLTGDRVEQKEGDSFLLRGRVDGITKVGGKRVDLEEIRQAIGQQPGVQDCFVLTLDAGGGRENRICALIQADDLDREQLMAGLRQRLEPYALPRIVRTTASMPMTGSGKYDLEAIQQIVSA